MTFPRRQLTGSDLCRIIVVVAVVNVAVYGCSRPAGDRNGSADRARALESRCVKLENDFRTMTQARDKSRAELAKLEEETARLHKELADRITARERDELLAQLKESNAQREEMRQALVSRTSERDKLKERAERLRKGLQSMLSADEGTDGGKPAATSAAPAGPALTPAT